MNPTSYHGTILCRYKKNAWFDASHRVEKYRPHLLDDVVGNKDTIDRLKVIAKQGNVPHLVISVSPSLSTYRPLLLTRGPWRRACLVSGRRRVFIV